MPDQVTCPDENPKLPFRLGRVEAQWELQGVVAQKDQTHALGVFLSTHTSTSVERLARYIAVSPAERTPARIVGRRRPTPLPRAPRAARRSPRSSSAWTSVPSAAPRAPREEPGAPRARCVGEPHDHFEPRASTVPRWRSSSCRSLGGRRRPPQRPAGGGFVSPLKCAWIAPGREPPPWRRPKVDPTSREM
jgi:hypothetical protein